jgi:protein-disulfide isomerase
MMMRLLRMLALPLAAGLSLTASAAPAASPAAALAPGGWASAMRVTPAGGHLYGNPDAKVKLVEYISYTCPHCAHFEEQSTGPLWQKYLPAGTVSVEVRHLIRDPIDMTAAVLANCGPPAKFLGNHAMLLSQQARWIRPLETSSDARRKLWETGGTAKQVKVIAADFGFYAMMQGRGYTRAQVDACLADPALPKRLAAQTAAANQVGINATPGLMLDGSPLAGTYDWATLQPQIDARL